jgi:hypothetical protein
MHLLYREKALGSGFQKIPVDKEIQYNPNSESIVLNIIASEGEDSR